LSVAECGEERRERLKKANAWGRDGWKEFPSLHLICLVEEEENEYSTVVREPELPFITIKSLLDAVVKATCSVLMKVGEGKPSLTTQTPVLPRRGMEVGAKESSIEVAAGCLQDDRERRGK